MSQPRFVLAALLFTVAIVIADDLHVFQCPYGLQGCATSVLEPLFDADFFSETSPFFERLPHLNTQRRSQVLTLIRNMTLLDWASMLETSMSRVMIPELNKYKTDPDDRTLDTARGMLGFPGDVEFFFPEGRGSREKRNAVINDVGGKMGPHRHVIPAKWWIDTCAKHGITLILRDADSRFAPLNDLAGRLRAALGVEVGISLYYTSPGRRGVEPHIDDMDVIMIPLTGRKRWTLRASTVTLPNEPIVTFHPVKHVAEHGAPGYFAPMEVTVQRGDVLYIPRGVIHNATDVSPLPSSATATPVGSLHVSVGIEPLPRKTVRVMIKAILPKLGSQELRAARVPGVSQNCFNGLSIVALAIWRDSLKDVQWRKAVLRPQHLYESTCSEKKSPVWQWARKMKTLSVALVNESAEVAQRDADRGKKVFDILRSVMGESKLRDWVDAWFDGNACEVRGADVMRKIGDHVDKDPKAVLQQIAADLKLTANTMADKSTTWWCNQVTRWHDVQTSEETKERTGEDRYLRLNTALAKRHPLAEPIVLDEVHFTHQEDAIAAGDL